MRIILGIGNPGKKYEGTRHNVGVSFAETLHREWDFPAWRRCGTDPVMISEGVVDGVDVVLAYSETYMNHSGVAGKALLERYKSDAEELLVAHDEIDIPRGEWKLSCNRGAGGHNGVRSLIDTLHTKSFCRLRIGISPTSFFGTMKKPPKERVHRFVLARMGKREEKALARSFVEIEKEVHIWLLK